MLRQISYKEDKSIIKEFKKLYLEAFPSNERIPIFILKYMDRKNRGNIYSLYDDDKYVGLLCVMSDENTEYVVYFAIVSELRCEGYGTSVLKLIKENSPDKRIILNIEEVTEKAANFEDRDKRKKFYLKNGFTSAPFKTLERGEVFETMVYGEQITKEGYVDFMSRITGSKKIAKLFTNFID